MSRAQSLLFGVAVVFAGWNILNNGLSVRSGAVPDDRTGEADLSGFL